MNKLFRSLLIILALCLSAGGVRASDRNMTILNDKDLATAKGGFCPFEVCEDAPGTGVCQTIPPATLCTLTTCKYSNEKVGNVEVFSCTFAGKYTCSQLRMYRQCVLAFTLSSCSNGPNPLYCGEIIEPECHIVNPDRQCVCGIFNTNTPCDWTNCLP